MGVGLRQPRRFTPSSFFSTLVNIVAGDRSSTLSLIRSFNNDTAPAKSSFSDFRKTIDPNFCYGIWQNQVEGIKRPTWRGLRVSAIDGDQYQLPANGDAPGLGYSGAAVKGDRETYYPRMYVSVLYDVLSGTAIDFIHSTHNSEQERAYELISRQDDKTLILYDRLYFSTELVVTHGTYDNFFVARLKVGEKSLAVVKSFVDSGKRNETVIIEGYEVHLIKFKNPKTGAALYFATNLPRSKFTNKEISELYTRRWDIETSYRDLTATMNLENWHSKSIQGILQEIYVGLWVFNQLKLIEFNDQPRSWHKKLSREYKRPCFKAILEWFTRTFVNFTYKITRRCRKELRLIIERTMEKRTRLSRSYPRASKQPAKKHSNQALVPRRR